MAVTAVAGFTEPFKNTHPFYRGPISVVGRTATVLVPDSSVSWFASRLVS
jgi:hypothetical protein